MGYADVDRHRLWRAGQHIPVVLTRFAARLSRRGVSSAWFRYTKQIHPFRKPSSTGERDSMQNPANSLGGPSRLRSHFREWVFSEAESNLPTAGGILRGLLNASRVSSGCYSTEAHLLCRVIRLQFQCIGITQRVAGLSTGPAGYTVDGTAKQCLSIIRRGGRGAVGSSG